MNKGFTHRVSAKGFLTVPFFRVGVVEARLGPIVAACTPNRKVGRFSGNANPEPKRVSAAGRRTVFA